MYIYAALVLYLPESSGRISRIRDEDTDQQLIWLQDESYTLNTADKSLCKGQCWCSMKYTLSQKIYASVARIIPNWIWYAKNYQPFKSIRISKALCWITAVIFAIQSKDWFIMESRFCEDSLGATRVLNQHC